MVKDSLLLSLTFVGLASSVLTVVGLSLEDLPFKPGILLRLVIFVIVYVVLALIILTCKSRKYQNHVEISIGRNNVEVLTGNILDDSLGDVIRVISCDAHFDTRNDDVNISKNSLQGQIISKLKAEATTDGENGIKAWDKAVEEAAKRLNLERGSDDLFSFPMGSIIPIKDPEDHKVYLLLALTKLDDKYEAHLDMERYEQTLMEMWNEISRVYAKRDIAIPLLGGGITRFSGGKSNKALLRCMLCTLNASGVELESAVKIVLYKGDKDKNNFSLYDYKDMFKGLMTGIQQ